MEFTIKPITDADRKPVIDIFNYYVANSFAAYPESEVPYEIFDLFLQASRGYPAVTVRDGNDKVIGFGFLRTHNPVPVFTETAEITYFISPEHTDQGIGAGMLKHLEAEGKKMGIRNILASISSLNPGSIDFHKKNGFTECGRFKGVGKKKDRLFDIVWMQKTI
jgi:L-amino acid N-acyltransferase YncA